MNTVTMMINVSVRDDGLVESIHVNGSRVPTASSSNVGYSTADSRAANMPTPPPPDVLRRMFGESDDDGVDREASESIDSSLDAPVPKVDSDAPPVLAGLAGLSDLPAQGGSAVDSSPPDIDADSERDLDEYPPELGRADTSSPADDPQPPAV